MRRKPGQLLELEARILTVIVGRDAEVHGFGLARSLADQAESKSLTSHGTLYKALGRLEAAGALSSHWEDSAVAEQEGRPRRRLYLVTGEGRAALQAHGALTPPGGTRRAVGELGIEWT